MTSLEALQAVLEASVARNGEKPLTNAYLLNIVKMTNRYIDRRETALRNSLDECLSDDAKWGSS